MATSLSSMGGMGGNCLQQRDPAAAAAYPSYMFAHHATDHLSSLQSSYNQRAAAAAAACSAVQVSSAASAHSYATATNAHAQTGKFSLAYIAHCCMWINSDSNNYIAH